MLGAGCFTSDNSTLKPRFPPARSLGATQAQGDPAHRWALGSVQMEKVHQVRRSISSGRGDEAEQEPDFGGWDCPQGDPPHHPDEEPSKTCQVFF